MMFSTLLYSLADNSWIYEKSLLPLRAYSINIIEVNSQEFWGDLIEDTFNILQMEWPSVFLFRVLLYSFQGYMH